MIIILNIIVLIAEAFYFYMPLSKSKNITNKKSNIQLYCGIFLANIISVLVFKDSIFRYLLYFVIIYLVLKISNKGNNSPCDFFIIPTLMLTKSILEYATYLIIYNNVNYLVFVIILEIVSISFVFCFYSKYNKIYLKINEIWNGINKFYFRYFILISFNSLIVFLLYNLIKIKEVL